jgi:hypothetical protein
MVALTGAKLAVIAVGRFLWSRYSGLSELWRETFLVTFDKWSRFEASGVGA